MFLFREYIGRVVLFVFLLVFMIFVGCTQEAQNKLGRGIQNWTGVNGVLDIYAGNRLVNRFIKIDKISTAMGTGDDRARAYRFGYGVLDKNQNFKEDKGEKKVYFEFSDYSTPYIFYENPEK
jgi:hypothetical protein